MKGSLKATTSVRSKSLYKTNFNDWSDPKCKSLKKISSITLFKKNLSSKSRVSKKSPVKDLKKESETLVELKEELLKISSKISKASKTSTETASLRDKIIRGSPLLTRKEIRIYKLSFHQSLIDNMKEDGFVGASMFLTDLLMMDEEWHKQQKENRNLKNRLFIKSNKPVLNILSTGLIKAELAKRAKKKAEEIKALFEMAVHFSNQNEESWYWLAEELYEQCIAATDGGDDKSKASIQELVAMAKHGYASFMLDVLHDFEQAKQLVEESMELSIGKLWKPDKMLHKKGVVLYLESCILLHKTYLSMAQEKKNTDIEEAIQFCRNSLHWARQGGCTKSETTALLALIIIYMDAGKLELVKHLIEKYMKLCKELSNDAGLCEGYVLRAKYHEFLGLTDAVIKDIMELLQIAEVSKNLKMVAVAHRKLATIYLIQGKQEETLKHAVMAYSYYITLENHSEKDESRCLTAIAQAQEIILQYLNLVKDAEDIDSADLRVLINWKMLHIPFFSNVKLFQPEVDTNLKLKNKVVNTKSEEFIMANKVRQSQMVSSQVWQKQLQMKQSLALTTYLANKTAEAKNMSMSLLKLQKQNNSSIASKDSRIMFDL